TWSQDGMTYTAADSPVVLDLTDANGCPYTATLTINEYDSTDDIVAEVTVCEGEEYTWSQDGMTYTAADSPVVLDLTDANGCPYTATLTITETPVLNAGEDSEVTVCLGVIPTFEELFDALGGNPDEGGEWVLLSNGDYVYSFEAIGGCPGSSAIVKVYYYDSTDDIVAEATVCEGEEYTWSQDGMTYTAADSPVILDLTDANGCSYTATLTITETQFLDAGENNEITVCEGVVPTFEELFDALGGNPDEGGQWNLLSNGDYIYSFVGNGACSPSAAIIKVFYEDCSDEPSQSVRVYPVPAASNSKINIKLDIVNTDDYSEDIEIMVYDALGRVIYSPRFYNVTSGSNLINFDLGNIEESTYMMVISGDDWSVTKRLIVK
ncbi:T9SS type A sorting domain-containing protein, partial [Psychroserpens sp.]|uniref:T9SS type A sorting domain-containing protein n=1 Tax=Psychroserpens sp. TaxID=2020870 RepID=UPI00385E2740